ncbi:hypothetical protein [Thalassobellus suaedae]|uniref:Uncharacterized protein n=1 Tax=Thalassobellus suaedae TaxID=3074124 RepID=A0ABY9XYI7_9FLAO|nr:hypothetical protein RHP51_09055 [Flavobacteriaceae bacterium HL-DH14]
MKKKNEIKYKEWSEHLTNTKEKSDYSLKRMDLMIISISGGGLYVLFETLREFKTGKIDIENTNLLLFTGIFLLVTILLNFGSQLSAYYANHFEEEYIQNELKILDDSRLNKKEKLILEIEQKKFDKKKNNFDLTTDILNGLSIITLITGLSLLTYFSYSIFYTLYLSSILYYFQLLFFQF